MTKSSPVCSLSVIILVVVAVGCLLRVSSLHISFVCTVSDQQRRRDGNVCPVKKRKNLVTTFQLFGNHNLHKLPCLFIHIILLLRLQ